MNRRTLLAGAGSAFGLAFAGCSAPTSRPPEPTSDAPSFGDSRVDEPPYEITSPSFDDGKDDWNAEYLGENMAGESELGFEPLDNAWLGERRIGSHAENVRSAHAATVITSPMEEREVFETFGPEIDYEDSMVVVVESGYGSSSVQHRWKRVEAFPKGVHLYGYYTRPWIQTSDYSARTSVVRVERPSEMYSVVPEARVSLTVTKDERVHFSSREGAVRIPTDE